MASLDLVKAHAYGNDFLLAEAAQVDGSDASALAIATCDRHAGVGADGLILYRRTADGASMTLYNPDGGRVEVSGNGVRCLAAWLTTRFGQTGEIVVRSPGGDKRLNLVAADGSRLTFRADMGAPSEILTRDVSVDDETFAVVSLWMGNPQCVRLGLWPSEEQFGRLGPALAQHPAFPNGTNVEFAVVERPDRVRIRIWERGVGPTLSSGTGSCAAAVAAAVAGGAARTVDVEAPGGTQRVEWLDESVWLTGWAELVLEGRWLL